MSRVSADIAPPRRHRVDRVWLATAVLVAVVLLVAPAQGRDTVTFTLESLLGVLPFLAASVAIAAWAKASGADALIAHAFQGRLLPMVALAAAFGALSPFCSCGVIPLIAALLRMGVPLPAVMAFWLASPVIDPSMFVLTAGVLGTHFAVGKLLAAAGLGLLGGLTVMALQGGGLLSRPLRESAAATGCTPRALRRAPVHWRFWNQPQGLAAFRDDAVANALFLGKWLTLAFVLESLMLAWVPAETIASLIGGEGWLTVVSAALVGVPAYLNGYAALPLVSGLVAQGMAPGAAMAFLVAGGVTSVPAAMAVYALARLPVFLAYMTLALAGAVLSGIAYGLA